MKAKFHLLLLVLHVMCEQMPPFGVLLQHEEPSTVGRFVGDCPVVQHASRQGSGQGGGRHELGLCDVVHYRTKIKLIGSLKISRYVKKKTIDILTQTS